MVFPPLVERLQIKYFNPIVKPIARYLPTFAVVKHRGRTSGTEYETVVNAFRKGNVLAVALAQGKTNWVKNVLAAGEADARLDVRRAEDLAELDAAGDVGRERFDQLDELALDRRAVAPGNEVLERRSRRRRELEEELGRHA